MALSRVPRPQGRQLNEPGGRKAATVQVTLTQVEHVLIAAQAKAAGVSRQRLMVDAVLNQDSGVSRAELHEVVTLFTGLERRLLVAGNNINQIAVAANSGALPELAQLQAARDYLVSVAQKIDAACDSVLEQFS